MKVKGIPALAFFAVLLLMQAATAQASMSITANPVSVDVNEGGSFSVDFDISTDADVFSNNLFIYFDNSVLNVTSVTEGGFLTKDGNETYALKVIENGLGRVRYYCTRLGDVGGVTGTGTMVTINFDTLDNGDSELGITNVAIYDPQVEEIAVDSVTNGSVDVNGAPVLSAIGAKDVNENALLEFSVSATDPDEDTLIYDADNLPDGASFVGQTFSWTPGYDQAGNYDVNFTVTDGSLVDYEVVTITVNDANRAPQITWYFPSGAAVGLLKGTEGITPFAGMGSQLFNHTSEDPDGDPLSYSWKLNDTEKSTDVSWLFTSSSESCGISTVQLEVSDGPLSDSHSWTVSVSLLGDANGDDKADIADLMAVGDALHTTPSDPGWNPDADFNGDDYVGTLEFSVAGRNYGLIC